MSGENWLLTLVHSNLSVADPGGDPRAGAKEPPFCSN